MFYTFIVLFEKIKYSDRPYGSLQRFYYKKRNVTNLPLTGRGCYNNIYCYKKKKKKSNA
jgi:hypothetical protein